jgi:hypothetical protein
MALVALVPTIAKLHATAEPAHAAHAHHGTAPHDHSGAPDDCWSACAYCDFLAHAPAIGSVDHLAAFYLGRGRPEAAPSTTPRSYRVFSQAALPRGPPARA